MMVRSGSLRRRVAIQRSANAFATGVGMGVTEILIGPGFTARNIDVYLEKGEAKRENLRLALEGAPTGRSLLRPRGHRRHEEE